MLHRRPGVSGRSLLPNTEISGAKEPEPGQHCQPHMGLWDWMDPGLSREKTTSLLEELPGGLGQDAQIP